MFVPNSHAYSSSISSTNNVLAQCVIKQFACPYFNANCPASGLSPNFPQLPVEHKHTQFFDMTCSRASSTSSASTLNSIEAEKLAAQPTGATLHTPADHADPNHPHNGDIEAQINGKRRTCISKRAAWTLILSTLFLCTLAAAMGLGYFYGDQHPIVLPTPTAVTTTLPQSTYTNVWVINSAIVVTKTSVLTKTDTVSLSVTPSAPLRPTPVPTSKTKGNNAPVPEHDPTPTSAAPKPTTEAPKKTSVAAPAPTSTGAPKGGPCITLGGKDNVVVCPTGGVK